MFGFIFGNSILNIQLIYPLITKYS